MNKKTTYLILFIYGLLIPKISGFLLIIVGLYKLFINMSKIAELYVIELFFLLIFLLSFYSIGISYGYYAIDNLIFFTFLSIMSYIFGATINLNSHKILHIFLFFIAGLTLYSFISVYKTYFTGNLEQALLNRVVNNMWNGVEENSPVFGAYGLMSLSLIIVLFLNNINKYEKIIIIIMVILTSIMLIAFQSRGPFVSAMIIFSISYLYLKRYQKITIFKVKYLIVIFSLIIFSISYSGDILTSNELLSGYEDRMEVVGAKSTRFELWQQGFEALFTQPFGGKEHVLQVGVYKSWLVHNTWLDISYATGIIPLFFILIFILKHLRYIMFLFSKANSDNDNIYFIIVGLSILLPTFFEPMVDASYIFVSLLGFYLALLKNYYYFKKGVY